MGKLATATIVLVMLMASVLLLPSSNANWGGDLSTTNPLGTSPTYLISGESPGPVEGLKAIPGDGKVLVTWMLTENGATHYRIYRGADAELANATMVGEVTDTYWYDDAVINGDTYYYFVEPLNIVGPGPIGSVAVVPGTSLPMTSLRIDNDGLLLANQLFYGWPGDGSVDDPITIAGLDIDAAGQGDGIFIGNTTYHVSIKESTVKNASITNHGDLTYGSGVALYNATNVFAYALNLTGNTGSGMVMDHSRNCRLNDSAVNGSEYGVRLLECSNCVVSDNEVFGCLSPIEVFDSEQCGIQGNVLGRDGENVSSTLLALHTDNCSVFGNTFHGNRLPVYGSDRLVPGLGMEVTGGGNLIYENTLLNCSIALTLYQIGSLDGNLIFDNMVNDGPVYYFHDLDMTGIAVPTGAGEVLLYNVTNATVQGQEQRSASFLVQAIDCRNITIENNSAEDCLAGIWMSLCFDSVVRNNSVNDSYTGIYTQYFDDNTIVDNSISGCYFGVYLEHWNHRNRLTDNECLNGTYGLWFGYANTENLVQGNRFVNNSDFAIILEGGSFNNSFFSNQFIDNNGAGATYDQNHSQVRDYKDKVSPGNIWQNGSSDGCGNFWSDQTSPDDDQDGIVDVPYLIETYPYTGEVIDLRPLAYLSGPPGRVSDLSVIVTKDAVELHWSPANNSMVVGTEGYKVYRWDSPSHRTLVANGMETSYEEGGLKDGVTYHYQVSAYNEHGEGPLSLNITVVTNTLPGAPLNLTGTIADGEASLHWEAPISDGGAVIDHYEIFKNGVVITEAPGLSATITDLSVGVTYTMTVRAHNINGAGPQSNTLVLIERVEPRAPVLSADWGDESVELTWNTPFNGGSLITQYILYKQLPGETEWSVLARTQGNSYDDLMVENGQTYAYRVRAVNAIGEGGLSNVVRGTPRTVPSAPEVYILNPGDKTLFASWTAPDNDGGDPVDQFSVYVGGVLYANTNGTDLTITGLTNGITYSVTVRAHNSVGLGPASEPMDAKPVGLPGTPQDLDAEAVPNRVTLTWTAPSEGGGAGPVQYRIYEGKAGRSDLIAIGTTTKTSYVMEMGLDDISVKYDYRVEAFNTLGVGGNATILDVTPSVVYITGKVVDEEGSPVAHATVQVQGGDQATSDQEGTFYVLAEPGPRVLWINGTGFESADLQVQVGTSPSQLGSVTLTSAQTDEPTEGMDPLIVVIPLVLVGALVAAFLVLRRRR